MSKFEKNMARDKRTIRELKDLGWRVLVIWECETRQPEVLHRKLTRFFGV